MSKSITLAALLGGLLLLASAWSQPVVPPAPPKPHAVVVAPPIAGGNAVLIVYEAGRLLPAKQAPIFNAAKLREWARTNQADLRVWDYRTQVVTTGDARFTEALRQTRPSLPWLYASIGGKGFNGPLPATLDETLTVLEGLR